VQQSRVLETVSVPRIQTAAAPVDRWLRWAKLAQVAADAGLAWLAFWLAYQLRYRFEWGGPVRPDDFEPFSTYYGRTALFVGLILVVFAFRGLYRLPRATGFLDEAQMLIGGITTAMAGVLLTAFLGRFVPSRLLFIYAWGLAVALLLARRIVSIWLRKWAWSREIGVTRVLVVGSGEAGRRVMQAMMGTPSLGYRVAGYVDDETSGDAMAVGTEGGVLRAERLGSTADVAEIVERTAIGEVIIALPANGHQRTMAIIDQCHRLSVTFKVVPDLLQLSLDRVDLGEVAGMPLLGVKDA
jgi:FlaA1/EpsC-like NDP-sugar epimerase